MYRGPGPWACARVGVATHTDKAAITLADAELHLRRRDNLRGRHLAHALPVLDSEHGRCCYGTPPSTPGSVLWTLLLFAFIKKSLTVDFVLLLSLPKKRQVQERKPSFYLALFVFRFKKCVKRP
jgi:hypothetical protein